MITKIEKDKEQDIYWLYDRHLRLTSYLTLDGYKGNWCWCFVSVKDIFEWQELQIIVDKLRELNGE